MIFVILFFCSTIRFMTLSQKDWSKPSLAFGGRESCSMTSLDSVFGLSNPSALPLFFTPVLEALFLGGRTLGGLG